MSEGWSASEKRIARRVYEAALNGELAEVMQTFKSMAARAAMLDDMWAVEESEGKVERILRIASK